MINLIPQKAKRRILIEYWFRVVTVWLTLWATALFIGAGILFPTYVLIGYQVAVYEESAAEASEKIASYENVSESLVQASQQARTIINESEVQFFSHYIKLIEGLQGEGIKVSKIQLNRTNEEIDPVILVGIARDRRTLASFRDRLLAEEKIVSADLPISNLASDSDIKFTITVVLVNKDSV
ncbi:MAG: hypothetical protein ACI9BF_000327 [Candidatus Paceibacteria bacterium]|jgi:hypothetical protein